MVSAVGRELWMYDDFEGREYADTKGGRRAAAIRDWRYTSYIGEWRWGDLKRKGEKSLKSPVRGVECLIWSSFCLTASHLPSARRRGGGGGTSGKKEKPNKTCREANLSPSFFWPKMQFLLLFLHFFFLRTVGLEKTKGYNRWSIAMYIRI